MSSCCNSSADNPKLARKFSCPVNNKEYLSVDVKTIRQHIKSPWLQTLNEERYYFCDDLDCDVVYFGLTGSVINKNELRTTVGVKEDSDDAAVCYCFGVSNAQAIQNPDIKTYVTHQTKEKNCACDVRNPSGRCCLKDFP